MAIAYGLCGAASVAAQFSLARVTLASLSGSELGAGLFLSFWLLFGGAGCLLYPAAARRRPAAAFLFLLLALGLLLPASCFAVVLARRLLFGFAFSLSLAQTAALAALAALPVAATVGALFGAAVRATPNRRPSVPAFFVADAVGSFAGGLVASFALAPHLSTMAIALLASAAVLLTGAAVAVRLRAGTVLAVGSAAAGVALAVLVAVPSSRDAAARALARARLPAGEIVASADSRFQSFAAVRSRESLSFYQDGILTWFSQAGEREEEIAHLALLPHRMPASILLVGSGWPFLPREILKHPVDVLTMVVEDEAVHRAGLAVMPAELAAVLSDHRVRLRYGDPQEVLRGSEERYGVVFIDGGPPDTLLSARRYTREFLQVLRGRLDEDGVVVLTAPTVPSQLSPALVSLHASLLATLRAVFGAAVAMAGEHAGAVIIAGRGVDRTALQADRLADVLDQRGIEARWVNRHSLATLLDPRRTAALERQLDRRAGVLNTLERPVLLLYSLEYREERSGGGAAGLALTLLRTFRLWHAAAGLLALALLLLIAGRLLHRDLVAPGCAAAAGCSGMVAELSLLGAFQVVSGNLYASLAGLVGCFMAGMAAGALAAPAIARRPGRMTEDRLLGSTLLLGLAGSAAMAGAAPALMASARAIFLGSVFIAMGLSGLCSGASVSLLLRQCEAGRPERIYGADLLGAAIGGICASALLLPVVGVSRSLWLPAMGYGFALALLVGGRLGREGG